MRRTLLLIALSFSFSSGAWPGKKNKEKGYAQDYLADCLAGMFNDSMPDNIPMQNYMHSLFDLYKDKLVLIPAPNIISEQNETLHQKRPKDLGAHRASFDANKPSLFYVVAGGHVWKAEFTAPPEVPLQRNPQTREWEAASGNRRLLKKISPKPIEISGHSFEPGTTWIHPQEHLILRANGRDQLLLSYGWVVSDQKIPPHWREAKLIDLNVPPVEKMDSALTLPQLVPGTDERQRAIENVFLPLLSERIPKVFADFKGRRMQDPKFYMGVLADCAKVPELEIYTSAEKEKFDTYLAQKAKQKRSGETSSDDFWWDNESH